MPKTQVSEKPFLWLNDNADKRFLYLYGGSSSGKSHTVAQWLILMRLFSWSNIGILVVRKTRSACKDSCWKLVRNWLRDMDFIEGEDYIANKSDLTITTPANSFMMFDGLDNVYKKKSIEGINIVWVEEAAGIRHDAMITIEEFLHLDINCRSHNQNGTNQIICTFNPVDPVNNQWLEDRTKRKDRDAGISEVLMLNHESNPFLGDVERQRIESWAEEDEEYRKIYKLGQWATPSYIIYERWDVVQDWPQRFDERVWGLDFGYSSNEAALVELRFVGEEEVYEREHIYQTGLTNPALISLMNDIVPKNEKVIADSAEPKSIQDILNAGFNVIACDKGPDSVRYGIDTVKRMNVHILVGSENLQKEKRGYKWKQDAQGNQTQEPFKFRNHLMDAERYAICKVKRMIEAGMTFAEPEERGNIIQQRYGISKEKEKPVVSEPVSKEDDIMNDDLWDIEE